MSIVLWSFPKFFFFLRLFDHVHKIDLILLAVVLVAADDPLPTLALLNQILFTLIFVIVSVIVSRFYLNLNFKGNYSIYE